MNGTQAESVTNKVQSYVPSGRKRRNPIQQAADLTIKAMLAQGTSIRAIADALHISKTTVQRVKKQMESRPADLPDLNSALLSPQRDEKLGKLVDHFLDKGLKLRKVKGSDALGAGKLYADRRWPVRSEAPPQVKLYVNVDLGQFRPDPLDSAQDVTPTTTPCVSADGKQTEGENLNQFKGSSVA
jgi:hypothetical protein